MNSLGTTFTDARHVTLRPPMTNVLMSWRQCKADCLRRFVQMQWGCSQSSDWLMFIPNATAAWVLGALVVAFIPTYIRFKCMSVQCSRIKLFYGLGIMLDLCTCLYLRAALPLSVGNKSAMYQESLIFNYFASLALAVFITTKLWTIMRKDCENPNEHFTHAEFIGLNEDPKVIIPLISKLPCFVSLVLYIAGICVMFNRNVIGMRLIQAALLFMLAWVSILCTQCLDFYIGRICLIDRTGCYCMRLALACFCGTCLWWPGLLLLYTTRLEPTRFCFMV
ncbi:hypothetical protein BX667DRAFT_222845 [Coemansia mojavensis]|nr:hypothetical protein BX667DRAFT_222845 [Coemansia mojavensis]